MLVKIKKSISTVQSVCISFRLNLKIKNIFYQFKLSTSIIKFKFRLFKLNIYMRSGQTPKQLLSTD